MPDILETLADGLAEMPSDISYDMKAYWLRAYLELRGITLKRKVPADAQT